MSLLYYTHNLRTRRFLKSFRLTTVVILIYAFSMRELHRHWKGIVLRGIIAIIFGIIALFAPGLGFQILVLYFGAFALLDGITALYIGAHAKSGLLFFEGIIGMLVGLYVFFFTLQATLIFILLIGVWAIATGALEIIAGIELRRHILNEIWLLFVGIISILFGLFVFVSPIASALALTFVIGIYATVFGLFLIALGLKVKNAKSSSIPNKKRRKL
jgi:uncharacterized membrane protein HdeD (DUF308 family)